MWFVAAFFVLLIVTFSMFWAGTGSGKGGALGSFQAFEYSGLETPSELVKSLSGSLKRDLLPTGRSENPFGVLIELQSAGGTLKRVEFDSRHLFEAKCFDVDSLKPLGTANRDRQSGAFAIFRSGFVFNPEAGLAKIFCDLKFQGPARLEIKHWDAQDIANANLLFQSKANLLDGAALSLAIFSLVVAAFGRSYIYLIFAAWSLVNFRVAGMSLGTDFWWLGHAIQADSIIWTKKLLLAANSLLSILLLANMFRDETMRLKLGSLVRFMIISGMVLLGAAGFVSYRQFLPLLWGQSGLS